MVIIFIRNSQKRKSYKAFVWNLPINGFDDFSQTTYAEDNTPNAKEDCLKKIIGSRKSLNNIVTKI